MLRPQQWLPTPAIRSKLSRVVHPTWFQAGSTTGRRTETSKGFLFHQFSASTVAWANLTESSNPSTAAAGKRPGQGASRKNRKMRNSAQMNQETYTSLLPEFVPVRSNVANKSNTDSNDDGMSGECEDTASTGQGVVIVLHQIHVRSSPEFLCVSCYFTDGCVQLEVCVCVWCPTTSSHKPMLRASFSRPRPPNASNGRRDHGRSYVC